MNHTVPQIKYKPGTEALAAALNEKISRLVRERPQDLVTLKKAIDERNSLINYTLSGTNDRRTAGVNSVPN